MPYDNTNTGIMYRDAKKTKDAQPDFTGFETIECPHCREQFEAFLAAWVRVAKKDGRALKEGQQYFSIKLTAKDDDRKGRRGSGNSDRDGRGSKDDRDRDGNRRDDRQNDQGSDRARSRRDDDIPF